MLSGLNLTYGSTGRQRAPSALSGCADPPSAPHLAHLILHLRMSLERSEYPGVLYFLQSMAEKSN